MRKLTLTFSAAVLALGAGTIAYAQQPERGMRGQDMTRTQAETMAAAAFERIDANGDGKIDADDRTQRRTQRREMAFERLDTDSNGVLSKEEFLAAQDTMRGGRGGKRGERMGRRGMRGAGMERGMGPGRGMVRNADSDGDGAISEAEFKTAALARFDAADADKDGTVTQEERKTMRDAMRKAMRAQRQNGNS